MAIAYNALASLPEAVLLLIIHHLRSASRRNLRLVCRRLHRIVSEQCSRLKVTEVIDSVQLHRTFPGVTELYLSSHLDHAKVITLVASNQKLLNQLKLLHLPTYCQWGEPDPALFLCFAASCRSLERITNDCDDDNASGFPEWLSPDLIRSLGNLCNLRVLDLDSFFSSNLADGPLQAITGLTGLSELKLNASGCSTGLTVLKKLACLQRLTVYEVHDDCGELLGALACVPTLTALELDCMAGEEGIREVLQLIRLLTQLQQLSLSGNCDLGYQGMEGLNHLRLLTRKHLSVCCVAYHSWPLELFVPLTALTHVTHLCIDSFMEQLGWLEHHVELQQLQICPAVENADSDLLQPLGCLTNLRLLRLEMFLIDNSPANILAPLSALKQLQQLDFMRFEVSAALTLSDLTALASLPALSKLSFDNMPKLPAGDVQQLPSFNAVAELEAAIRPGDAAEAAASVDPQLGDVQLLLLCKLVPNVRRLKLEGISQHLSARGFTQALEQLPHLTSLHLSRVNELGLPDHAFASICRLTGLEELTLMECANLSLGAVVALLQVSSLRVLQIQECEGVSEEELQELCHLHRRADVLPLDW